VSLTFIIAYWPGATSSADGSASSTFAVSIVSDPPSGIASRAFDDEIQKRALELVAVRKDGRQRRGEACLDVDRLAERPGDHVLHVADERVDVERSGLEPLHPREDQHPLDELTRAAGRALRRLDRLHHSFGQRRCAVAALRQLQLETSDLEVAHDHLQDVVEVVGRRPLCVSHAASPEPLMDIRIP